MNCEDIIRVKYLNFHEYKMKEIVTRVEISRGGGGGRKKRKWKYVLTIQSIWSPHFQVKSLGGDECLEFCRYTWNFVRTNETTQGHHCIDKILVISNEMRRIVCFRRENTKLSAYLARSHSFHFFRVSGSTVSSLGTTKQINQHKDIHVLYRKKIMLLYQQDIIDWLRRITCFRRKSAKISVRSLHSPRNHFYGFFSSFWFSGRNKSSWKGPYHECYDIGAGRGGGDRGGGRPQSKKCVTVWGEQNAFCPPPPPKKRRRGRKKNIQYIQLRLVYSNV